MAAAIRVELTDGETRDLGTIELTMAGRIAGHVVDDRGEPLPDATVVVEPGGSESAMATTDEAGAFAVDGLALGPQRLTVKLRSVALEQVGGRGSVELTAARPEIDDLTIRAAARRARLAGRVIARSGEPLSDVSLYVRGEDDSRSWSFVASSAVTGSDGRFRIDNLPVGRYALRAAQRGGGDVVLRGIEAPSDALEIVLAVQGAIEGRLEQFTGAVEVVVTSAVDHRSRRASVEGDRFHLTDLAAGDYLIVARGDNAIATTSVHVVPPEPARPVLRAATARRVTGVVRELASNAPVPGMLCAAAPAATPAARLWYASAPSTRDGRFEIVVGSDDVAILCDGDASLVNAARAAAGGAIELWTVRRASHSVPAIGIAFGADPLVPRVARVEDNSAVQRMGLRTGDVIVQIGNQPLDGIGTDAAVELWLQRFTRSDVGVIRDGKVVTLHAQG